MEEQLCIERQKKKMIRKIVLFFFFFYKKESNGLHRQMKVSFLSIVPPRALYLDLALKMAFLH